MKANPIKLISILILVTLFMMSIPSHAQKTIVISESLAANSEKWSVKMGTQWMGKIWNIRFGEYAVVSSKMGWTTTSNKSKLFNRKTESKTTNKFSFVLRNNTADSARVNAATYTTTQFIREIELLPNLYLDGTLLKDSSNFSAFININGDTTEVWTLSRTVTQGKQIERNYEFFLTDGKREILLIPTNSNKNGEDSRSLPALGYEFIEDFKSLSALQYYGGGAFGANKNIVWMGNENDPKMKLVLAAAITAVLQISTVLSTE